MPMASDVSLENNETPAKVAAYGVSQTRKTWWLLKAAEAGFNVLYLDGDGNSQVMANISDEGKKRIAHIQCLDAGDNTDFVTFVAAVLKSDGVVYWNDDLRKPAYKHDPKYNMFAIDLASAGIELVLGIDSFTALAQKTIQTFATKEGIDLLDVEDGKLDRSKIYAAADLAFSALGQYIKGVRCHVIVIGHEDIQEKRRKTTNEYGHSVEEVYYTRQQFISISKNNAVKMEKYFSDILWFTQVGTDVKINTKKDGGRAGGVRLGIGDNHKWDQYQFIDHIRNSKLAAPTGEGTTGFIWLPKGTEYSPRKEFTTTKHEIKTPLSKAPMLSGTGPFAHIGKR